MTKSNNKLKSIIILVILAIVYSVIVFALPLEMNAVFWISYVFTMAAIVGQAVIWHFAWGDSEALRSKFYGFPVILVGTAYLGVQLTAGLVFMLLAKWIAWWIPLVVYVVLLGIMLIGCITADVSRDVIERIEEEQVRNTSVIKEMRAMAITLRVPETEKALADKVEDVKEALKYCDPVSSDKLQEIEVGLKENLQSLDTLLREQEYGKAMAAAEQFLVDLQKRNELCKAYKREKY